MSLNFKIKNINITMNLNICLHFIKQNKVYKEIKYM